jgi:hypothetical protein
MSLVKERSSLPSSLIIVTVTRRGNDRRDRSLFGKASSSKSRASSGVRRLLACRHLCRSAKRQFVTRLALGTHPRDGR